MPGFRVLDVSLEPGGDRWVLVASVADEGGCPSCGVLSVRVKDRPTSRVKDLPHGPVRLRVWAGERRFVCAEWRCERRSFTETSDQLPTPSGPLWRRPSIGIDETRARSVRWLLEEVGWRRSDP